MKTGALALFASFGGSRADGAGYDNFCGTNKVERAQALKQKAGQYSSRKDYDGGMFSSMTAYEDVYYAVTGEDNTIRKLTNGNVTDIELKSSESLLPKDLTLHTIVYLKECISLDGEDCYLIGARGKKFGSDYDKETHFIEVKHTALGESESYGEKNLKVFEAANFDHTSPLVEIDGEPYVLKIEKTGSGNYEKFTSVLYQVVKGDTDDYGLQFKKTYAKFNYLARDATVLETVETSVDSYGQTSKTSKFALAVLGKETIHFYGLDQIYSKEDVKLTRKNHTLDYDYDSITSSEGHLYLHGYEKKKAELKTLSCPLTDNAGFEAITSDSSVPTYPDEKIKLSETYKATSPPPTTTTTTTTTTYKTTTTEKTTVTTKYNATEAEKQNEEAEEQNEEEYEDSQALTAKGSSLSEEMIIIIVVSLCLVCIFCIAMAVWVVGRSQKNMLSGSSSSSFSSESSMKDLYAKYGISSTMDSFGAPGKREAKKQNWPTPKLNMAAPENQPKESRSKNSLSKDKTPVLMKDLARATVTKSSPSDKAGKSTRSMSSSIQKSKSVNEVLKTSSSRSAESTRGRKQESSLSRQSSKKGSSLQSSKDKGSSRGTSRQLRLTSKK